MWTKEVEIIGRIKSDFDGMSILRLLQTDYDGYSLLAIILARVGEILLHNHSTTIVDVGWKLEGNHFMAASNRNRNRHNHIIPSFSEVVRTVDPRGFQAEGTRVVFTNHRADTLQIAGSRLPNCMRACGSCLPCRLVRVRFGCSLGPTEAEACPVAYRCMCSNKAYHVP
ncbi:hypothetical protein Ccrd_019486 [Cynara cardunculus var. scolymus]|uniref:Epidermal patterning factor-like protein n=1 Tax=Cynara cardunculus var. scolymus TaxID=59895 RepID=A0A124SF53_CYNCS|nr:hypothetical protein Ccrd_019486 [Cynara cardunculus var. scolymus]